MASLGSGTLASAPAPLTIAASLTPHPGNAIAGAVTLVDFEGGGGATVDPLRYLNVGGVAVPIQ